MARLHKDEAIAGYKTMLVEIFRVVGSPALRPKTPWVSQIPMTTS